MPILFQVIYYEINRISSLDLKEFVLIIASFHSIGAKELDYSRYSEDQIKAMESAERFNPVTSLGVKFTQPLRNYPCLNFDFYMTLWSQYENHGTLPFMGCLVDQPAFVIDVLNTLKALVNESREKERKRQEKKNGSGLG